MSPIFVRPVREQLEHDRLVRYLHVKYKRKFEVAVNAGDEQTAPVKIGPGTFFPDLVLTADRKIAGLVEVETGESVNNLEALAQWVHFARARVPFHLYVPVSAYDAARRLCEARQVRVTEIWTYRAALDGFDLVRIYADAGSASSRPRPAAGAKSPPPPVQKAAKPVPPKILPPKKPVAVRPAAAKSPRKPPPRPAKASRVTARASGRAKSK